MNENIERKGSQGRFRIMDSLGKGLSPKSSVGCRQDRNIYRLEDHKKKNSI
jgi:hypothetical protein